VSAVDPEKLEKYRARLREEWTEPATVEAWRKWQLRPGLRVLDLASGVGDPALSVAQAMGPRCETDGCSRAEAEIFAALRKLSDGPAITMPLEIVMGTGIRT
jgi:ubiquinone/menaquinone biosynthesis C-methylase UbiE